MATSVRVFPHQEVPKPGSTRADSAQAATAASGEPVPVGQRNVLHVGPGCRGNASMYLARRTDLHELCALKAVQKHKIAQCADDLRHLRSEKEVMELLDSPFVVGARGTFQDSNYVYFAQDYMPGGDLYRRLRKAGGRLPLDQVQFFAAGTVLAVQHLHRRGCVHRDIKPENILLDADGYPRLMDFGFSRKLAKGEHLLNMFGTHEYVAPEVLLGQGHTHAADLWSLGVLINELLVGSTPWCATAGHAGSYAKPPSTEHIYHRITSGHVPFPPDMDPSARDLIAQLLQQDPRKRLGVAGRGPAGLRAHKFFRRIGWAALNARRVPAPYVLSVARRRTRDRTPPFFPPWFAGTGRGRIGFAACLTASEKNAKYRGVLVFNYRGVLSILRRNTV